MQGTDAITFGLAVAGYASMGLDVVLQRAGRAYRLVSVGVVLLVVSHVTCVWALRYGWSVAKATERLGGFVIFHAALAMLIAAAIVDEKWRRFITPAAFLVVTAGAVGAVFKFEYVEPLRIPVLLVPVLTAVGTAWALLANRTPRVDG